MTTKDFYMGCELLKPISEDWKPSIDLELTMLHDILKMQNASDEFLKGFEMCLNHYRDLNEAINEYGKA